MLESARRRSPPPPIRILGVNPRDEPAQKTSPLKDASPALGPFPATTTTATRSPKPTLSTTQIRVAASTTNLPKPASLTKKSSTTTLLKPTIATSSRVPTITTIVTKDLSPTKTSFVTVTQSIGSPKEKGEKSPDGVQTVFISGAPQIVTVTVGGGAQGTLTAAAQADSIGKGANVLPTGAVAPLVALIIVAGVSAIVTVVIILWRRRKKRKEKKIANEVEDVQRAMTEVGDDREGGFRAVPDTQPIMLQ